MSGNVDRRAFLARIAAATGGAIITPVGQLISPAAAFAKPSYRAFEFVHDPSVDVVLDFANSARRYDVIVRDGGTVVESFSNVDTQSMDKLKSDRFDVIYFDAPTAA